MLNSTLFWILLWSVPRCSNAIREHDRSFAAEDATQQVREASNATAARVTIRAYWMRHGISCANIIRNFALTGILAQHTYADPNLCDCAINLAQALGRKIHPLIAAEATAMGYAGSPLVFSSVLVRSMETALYNFPGADVYPIPYIAEADSGKDNTPVPWYIPDKTEDQQDQKDSKLNRAPNDAAMINRLKFVDGVNDADDPDRDSKLKDDYDMFRKEFPKILSALLPEEYITAGATIPVIIVSHSGYMKNNLKCDGKNKPRNNEVWTKDYVTELVRPSELSEEDRSKPRIERISAVLEDASSECESGILDQSVYPEYAGKKWMRIKKYPCADDVARCSKTNKFMPSEFEASCCPSVA